ncbi:MAG TPA: hypothetical protein VG188_01030 [Solirubrobacteraceae bacterium]|jgi:hypothetical protein|nr:hypothetical protein [Solirubrobacteraceae bacterium]
MPKELHWELVAGTAEDIKDRLGAAINNAAAEGFTDVQHVSHDMALVNGTAPLVSVLLVLGKPED